MYLDGDDRMLTDTNDGGARVPGRRGRGRYRHHGQSHGGRRHDGHVHGDGDAAAVVGRDAARPCREPRHERGTAFATVQAWDDDVPD